MDRNQPCKEHIEHLMGVDDPRDIYELVDSFPV